MLATYALLLLAPGEVPEWKLLLERVEALAVSEPPVLGVDTRIRAAHAIASKQPGEARRLLEDAASLTYSFTDANTRAVLLNDVYHEMAQVNRAAAEELAANMVWSAYRAMALRTHFEETLARKPESAALEFAQLISALPSKATVEEVRQLLYCAQMARARLPDLTKEALAKARGAVKDRGFPGETAEREELLAAIAAVEAGSPVPDERNQKKKDEEPETPDVKGMDEDEVVALARKQPPLAAMAMLLSLLEDDKPVATQARRSAIAWEALELSPKLPPNDDRLVVQSMLTRRLFTYGDLEHAAAGARMLAETYQRRYDCESAACTTIKLNDNPGEPIMDFAEYLLDNGIRPADLGLHHISLDARVLVLDLEKAATGKRKRFGLF